jgi:hypothetical protein
VYTCGAFDPKTVLAWLQQYNPVKVEYKYIDREHGLTELITELNYTPTQSYSVAEIVEAMDSIQSR